MLLTFKPAFTLDKPFKEPKVENCLDHAILKERLSCVIYKNSQDKICGEFYIGNHFLDTEKGPIVENKETFFKSEEETIEKVLINLCKNYSETKKLNLNLIPKFNSPYLTSFIFSKENAKINMYSSNAVHHYGTGVFRENILWVGGSATYGKPNNLGGRFGVIRETSKELLSTL
ncbi:hypothetical protein HYS72_03520 [Candidatus Pacearchaeota archaeon]|nr:hypothetical protein [Candidatus Pacearchaeota archaeon]MBI2057136.1 hypothetical protein [Candidatus Pacearchaeota archaeon]